MYDLDVYNGVFDLAYDEVFFGVVAPDIRPGGICQRVTMFPHIQSSVSATHLINQSNEMRPYIQQITDMGCQDGC
jgi:hypothetical protein